MMGLRHCLLGAALLAAWGGPALAAHGKVGLWNVTSTTEIALTPDAEAALKKSGQKMPALEPVTVQMCMSKEEVESNTPPHLDREATSCVMTVVTQTAALLEARMICDGKVKTKGAIPMKGNGAIHVAYRGAEHYTGSYTFRGTTNGAPTNLTTRFKGDWLKADCGKIPAYRLRTQ
jgi:hypothetical protein